MTKLTVKDFLAWVEKNIPTDSGHLDQPLEINVHFKCVEDLAKVKCCLTPDPFVSGKLVILGKGKTEFDWSSACIFCGDDINDHKPFGCILCKCKSADGKTIPKETE